MNTDQICPVSEPHWTRTGRCALYESRVVVSEHSIELPSGEKTIFEVDESIPFAVAVLIAPSQDAVILGRATKKLDVGRVTIKGLRHTHATLPLELGVHPKVVQERLGHSTVTTTKKIYSHVTPTMQRQTIDRLTQHLNGA